MIGEDASTDKTREICFEYQKRYPDKIRVLWWHENLRKVRHPAGGNGNRTTAHCRGEFIAFCEGDDYWIDPLKLQKQVDVMRSNPTVGLCFCDANIMSQKNGNVIRWNEDLSWKRGMMSGREFATHNIFGVYPEETHWPASTFIMTASTMYRKAFWGKALNENELCNWKLQIGDSPTWLGLATVGDVYFLDDVVSIYRLTSTGLSATSPRLVILDTRIVQLYFYEKIFNRSFFSMPRRLFTQILAGFLFYNQCGRPYWSQVTAFFRFLRCKIGRAVLLRMSFLPFLPLIILSGARLFWRNLLRRYYIFVCDASVPPKWLIDEYAQYGVSIQSQCGSVRIKLRRVGRYLARLLGRHSRK